MVTKTKKVYLNIPPYVVSSNAGTSKAGGALIILNNTRTGTSNPNWKTQVKANVSATTGMSATREYFEATNCSSLATRIRGYPTGLPPPADVVDLNEGMTGGYAGTLLNLYVPSVSAPTIGSASARNQALTRLHQAIRAQSTHFSGPTFLGEFRESVGTIRNIAKKFAQKIPAHLRAQQRMARKFVGQFEVGANGSAVRTRFDRGGNSIPAALSRGSRPAVASNADKWREMKKNLADNYLEFAFGVRPLVKDVKDAAETIARFQYDTKHVKVRGYGSSSELSSVAVNKDVPGNLTTVINTVTRTQQCEVVYRVGLQFAVDSPAFGSAARLVELSGFTWENFIPSIWNLLPYSFLVDYFLNVGDILNCLTTDLSSVRWANRTTISTREASMTCSAGEPPFVPGKSAGCGGDFGYAKRGTRSIVRDADGVGIPTPELTIPSLTRSDGTFNTQWLNMTALLAGGSGARRGF